MPFRDDRDALRERADQLERELSKAREDLGKLRLETQESSEEADDLRKKVERLESERASLPGAPRKRSTKLAVGVALAVVLVVVFFAERSYRQSQDYARRQVVSEQLRQARQESDAARARMEELERAAQETARPTEPASNPEAIPMPVVPLFDLTWAAKVKRAEGVTLRRGAACEVRASMTSDHAVRANVACGQTSLYDWDEPLGTGMQMRSCSFEGSTENTLGLRCSDTGPRTGRPQLAIDSLSNTATVWKDGGMRVELTVDTAPRENGRVAITTTIGSGLAGGFPPGLVGFPRVVRLGRVTKVVGDAGVARGAHCAVVVTTGEPPHACRASIQCADRALYGGGTEGFADCVLQNGRPTSVTDSNPTSHGGDPRLDLDLVGNRAVVSDDSPEWSVTMVLQPG